MVRIGLIPKLVTLLLLAPLQFIYPQVNLTSQLSPVIEHCGPDAGLYICIQNDSKFPLVNAPLRILIDSGLEFSKAELNTKLLQIISKVPQEIEVNLSQLEPCQEICMFIYFTYNCLNYTGERKVKVSLQNGNDLIERQDSLFAFSPQLELSNIEVKYDPLTNIFSRTMQLSNIGNTKLSNFLINNSGRKIETILSSNFGQISNGGKALEFKSNDFLTIGNGNSFFDPGEFLIINQNIKLDSCIKDLKFEFDLEISCKNSSCLYKILTNQINLVNFSSANPRYIGSHDTKYSFSDSIIIPTKLFLFSSPKYNVVSNAYDISLDIGWLLSSSVPNYFYDGKIENVNLIFGNKTYPLILKGKIYPFQFNIFTSDPDGQGGLSDLDGDGEFDDLLTGDTIKFIVTASVNPKAYNLNCQNNILFTSHTFGMDIHHSNFCKDKFITKAVDENGRIYSEGPTYVLNREYSNSIISFTNKYPVPGTDTLFLEFQYYPVDNFRYCNNPRIKYTVQFPSSVHYDTNYAIIAIGKIRNVVTTDSTLTFEANLKDLIKIPIQVFCNSDDHYSNLTDSAECYKCRNNSFAAYQFRISSEIKCEESNKDWIPYDCLTIRSTIFECNFIDEPKHDYVSPVILESFIPKRLSYGHTDSTQKVRINPNIDSVDLLNVSQLDTFEIKIKLSSSCKFNNYKDFSLLLRLGYYANYHYPKNDIFFPYELFNYQLLFYKSNNQLFFEKTKNMILPRIYKDHNDYWFSTSELLDDPLVSQYSISEFDSVVLIVNGRISKNVLFDFNKPMDLTIFLNSVVGNCTFSSNKGGLFNFVNSNKYYTNEYLSNAIYNSNFSATPTCDSILLKKNLGWDYYIYLNDIDYYHNEYRKPVKIKSLSYLIPKYFEPYPDALTRKFYNGNYPVISIINKFVKNYYSGDTLRFDNLLDWEDFDNAKTELITYLKPRCYIDIVDSIQGFIDAIHYYNKTLAEQERVNVRTSVVYKLPGLKLASYLDEILFLKDTVSNWLFEIRTPENLPNSRFNPNNVNHYHKFDNIWLYVESISGLNYPFELEVLSARGVKRILMPVKMNTNNAWIFKLDSVQKFAKCSLRVVNKNCSLDSFRIILGNSCDGYPSDLNNLPKTCITYAPTKTLLLDSRPALLDFVAKNPTGEIRVQNCDSVIEEYSVKNLGLGYSFNNILHVQVPIGVAMKSAYLKYPSGSNTYINVPVLFNNITSEYDVEISQVLNRGFLPGFIELDSSSFELKLVYNIDCNVENGEAISYRLSYYNLCDQLQSKIIKYSPKIFFTEKIPANNYLIDYKIIKSNSCTDSLQLRVKLLRLNSNPNFADRFTLNFDKKLFFNKNSLIQSSGINKNYLKHLQSNESESLTFELKDQQRSGDSVVIFIPLNAWCQSNCTSTSMQFNIEELKDIECYTSPGGRCTHYSISQSFTEDSLKLYPKIDFDKVNLLFSKVSSNQTKIKASILLNYTSKLQLDQLVNLKVYHDSNGDGRLNSSDQLLQSISYPLKLDGASQILLLDSLLVDPTVSCPLIFAIMKEDNLCLCYSDTLIINSQIDNRIQNLYNVCENDSLLLDFTNLLNEGIVINFENNPFLQKQSENVYIFHKTIESRNAEEKETIKCNFGYNDLCKDSKTIQIVIHAIDARINLVKDISCYNSTDCTIEAISDLNASNLKFQWAHTKDSSSLLTNMSPGTYYVTITDNNNCSSTTEYVLNNKPKLELNLNSILKYNPYHLACFGDKDASIVSSMTGNQGNVTFQLNGANVLPPFKDLGAGKYKMRITDEKSCVAEDSIILLEPDSIEITSKINLPICYDSNTGSIELSINGGVPDYKYLWEDGSNTNSRQNLSAGIYQVSIIDQNNCIASDSFVLNTAIQEKLNVSPKDTTIEFGQSYILRLDFSSFIQKIIWSPATYLNCDDCQNPIATPKQDSKFTVIITDTNGCNYFDSLMVRINYNPKIYFPNVFSPNGDGINDNLILYGTEQLQSINSINIFNRWGGQVYSKSKLDLQDNYPLWDGTMNGKTLNPGVYVYSLDVTIKDGTRVIVNGEITLVH